MSYNKVNKSDLIQMNKRKNGQKKVVSVIIASIFVLVTFLYNFGTIKSKYFDKTNTVHKCYRIKNSLKNINLLDDIEISPPKLDKSIFFIDTSCYNDSRVTLSARKACAIESAAKLNPNRDVYILFMAPVGFVPNEPDSPVLEGLKSYRNVYFRHVDIYRYSKNTPADQWIQEDHMFLSPNSRYHLSDYLRLITLYKFGGIYFDMDFVILQNFDNLPPNFAPQEKFDKEYINNSVLGFESKNVGHQIVEMILRECFENYVADTWDYNGPWAVWRATQKICNKTKMIDMMKPEFCWGFKIMPQVAFFPFRWFTEAFDTNQTVIDAGLKKITNQTIAIHLWSSNSRNVPILKSKDSNIYTIFAEKYCPKSYGASGLYFN